jgi:OTU domain-containing protein 6
MGSKKNKLKKAFSPPFQQSPPPPPERNDDAELLDDLLSQLDSQNHAVQAESARVIQEIHKTQEAESDKKKDPKSRFQARQVPQGYSNPVNR